MNQGKKVGRVSFEHSLSQLEEGFVAQIVCALTHETEVYRAIGQPEELRYRVADDMQEMHVQMTVDFKLQQLRGVVKNWIVDQVKNDKLYIPADEEEQKIILLPEKAIPN